MLPDLDTDHKGSGLAECRAFQDFVVIALSVQAKKFRESTPAVLAYNVVHGHDLELLFARNLSPGLLLDLKGFLGAERVATRSPVQHEECADPGLGANPDTQVLVSGATLVEFFEECGVSLHVDPRGSAFVEKRGVRNHSGVMGSDVEIAGPWDSNELEDVGDNEVVSVLGVSASPEILVWMSLIHVAFP